MKKENFLILLCYVGIVLWGFFFVSGIWYWINILLYK